MLKRCVEGDPGHTGNVTAATRIRAMTDTSLNPQANSHPSQQSDERVRISGKAGDAPRLIMTGQHHSGVSYFSVMIETIHGEAVVITAA